MRPRLALLVAIGAILLIPARGRVHGGDQAQSPQLASAEECGRCHRDIHKHWKASMHAQAADNPRFQDALQTVRASNDSGAAAVCARCHAPAAVYNGDTKWERQATWEGVTCDFCHSVRDVKLGSDRPFVLDIGGVKSGPLKNAVSPRHGTRFAAMYTSSTICAACHQYVNKRGLDVLSTFAEWQGSEYAARNTTCQQCHMPTTPGRVVDPSVAKTTGAVNLHAMPGGHSVAELNRALHALISAERRDDQVVVTLRVANRGAGHALPTGSPLRSIVMDVEVDAGFGERQTLSRTFARTIVDEDGGALLDEAGVFTRGAQQVSDTRLKPGERRTEHFSFKVPRDRPVRAVARFFYRYGPQTIGRGAGLPFLTINAWLDAAK